MLVMKRCPVCGKAFEKTSNRQVCCSKECANKRHGSQRLARDRAAREANAVRAKCLTCGKEFVKRQMKQKFCCGQCKRKHDIAFVREKRNANPKIRKCIVCGKEFRVTRGPKAVCSNACRKIRMNETNRRWKKSHRESRFAKCPGCGKVFQVVGGPVRYCPECRANGFGKKARVVAVRNEFGLTYSEAQAVIYDQDVRPFEERYEASKLWTPKQRKFAISRYNKKHGLHDCYCFN